MTLALLSLAGAACSAPQGVSPPERPLPSAPGAEAAPKAPASVDEARNVSDMPSAQPAGSAPSAPVASADTAPRPAPGACDGSGDCAAGERCCRVRDEAFCEPLSPAVKGRYDTRCLYSDAHELCADGSVCRTPGTSCVAGSCRKQGVRLKCGQASCEGDTPVCCFDGSPGYDRCEANKCSRGQQIECRKLADCPSGQVCCAGTDGAHCGVYCADMDTVLCSSHADCAKVQVPGAEGEMEKANRCVPYVDGLKRCWLEGAP